MLKIKTMELKLIYKNCKENIAKNYKNCFGFQMFSDFKNVLNIILNHTLRYSYYSELCLFRK